MAATGPDPGCPTCRPSPPPSPAWNAASSAGPPEPSRPFTGHRLPVGDIAMSAEGRLLAGAGTRGTVWIWDATSPFTPGRALRGPPAIVGVAVSADGRTLAGYDSRGAVWAWDTARPERPAGKQLLQAPDRVRDVALGGDGKVLAAATYSSGVLVWDPAGGGPPRSFTGLRGAIRKVAVSADRTTIASVDTDGSARLRSVDGQGQTGPQLDHLSTGPADLALDGRGATLVAPNGDGDLQVWRTPVPPGAPAACERLAARVHGTPEWTRHLGDLTVREACHL
ncbi:WD40 repeat domain-containing protein [Nonomuraea gerenzanensis]|uniref:WD-40 repeat protein n=1 Tax=Nonomuraea gerenzanensis TaxID=93944 RepID=A0A1M4EGH8_9ACTN|nr:hypothetical protein [Nonomuraea gerenzanensis]UBU09503.1 hypothetical protein LCN96_34710 [Nonomuraea gerenzanensis]SBO97920.1 WD-40 repeat protein [Nonomuraea gerenzanensis]